MNLSLIRVGVIDEARTAGQRSNETFHRIYDSYLYNLEFESMDLGIRYSPRFRDRSTYQSTLIFQLVGILVARVIRLRWLFELNVSNPSPEKQKEYLGK